jgi:hypothetical protein
LSWFPEVCPIEKVLCLGSTLVAHSSKVLVQIGRILEAKLKSLSGPRLGCLTSIMQLLLECFDKDVFALSLRVDAGVLARMDFGTSRLALGNS